VADACRLPRHILPTRYELRITPDLTAATFAGDATSVGYRQENFE